MKNRIQEVLDIKGWTQKDFERETGIAQSTLSRIINGKMIYLDTAKKIAKALGYPVEYIWPD